MRIVASRTGHRLAFDETAAFHQSQQLIGGMWIIVIGIFRIHIQLKIFVQWLARSVRERRLQLSSDARVALSTNFIGAHLGEFGRVGNVVAFVHQALLQPPPNPTSEPVFAQLQRRC